MVALLGVSYICQNDLVVSNAIEDGFLVMYLGIRIPMFRMGVVGRRLVLLMLG